MNEVKIVRLTPAGPILEPDQDIIAALEGLLAQAKAGQIKGLGYCLVTAGNATETNWIGGCAEAAHMIAAVSRLHFGMLTTDAEDGK